jgi:hypothetical protein
VCIEKDSSESCLFQWLAGWNAFRTGEYLEGVEFPQTLVQQAQKILAIVATTPN